MRNHGRSRARWRRWFFVLPAVAVVIVALGLWREDRLWSASGIPGPIGGPQIAQDVNTMLGRKAPAFRLRDGQGQAYAVTPGRGRPLVVISHMGFY